jgi:glycerophosphoryl diester phosphodiesterase
VSRSLALPKVIGHRGTPCRAPENSLAGFGLAARSGVTWVELDVQLSRDLVPVVFHDETLDRTSSGQGRLVETDFAILQSLDVGSWFSPAFAGERLPSWEAVLGALIALDLGVNIEIKADDERGALTSEIGLAQARAQWPSRLPPPLVTSFSRAAVAAAGRCAPDWPRGLVSHDWPDDWREFCAEHDCATLHVAAQSIDERRVALAREAGLAVLAYVVDDRAMAHQLWRWGVLSVFSDRPEQLLD